jgi:hypothetical protein
MKVTLVGTKVEKSINWNSTVKCTLLMKIVRVAFKVSICTTTSSSPNIYCRLNNNTFTLKLEEKSFLLELEHISSSSCLLQHLPERKATGIKFYKTRLTQQGRKQHR